VKKSQKTFSLGNLTENEKDVTIIATRIFVKSFMQLFKSS